MKKAILLVFLLCSTFAFANSPNQVTVGTIERNDSQIITVRTNPIGDISISFFGSLLSFSAGESARFERAIAKGLELIAAVNDNNVQVAYSRSLGSIPSSKRGGRISFTFSANRTDSPPSLHGAVTAGTNARSNPVRWALYEDELRELQQLLSTARTTQGDLSEEIALLNNLFKDWSLY
jgi:hypothetical protein